MSDKVIYSIIVFFILVIGYSCDKGNPIQPNSYDCVINEEHVFQDTSFLIDEKGRQENGYAKCLKNGKVWEASFFATKILEDRMHIKLFVYPDTFAIFSSAILNFLSVPIEEKCFVVCNAECQDSIHVITNHSTKLSFDERGDVYELIQEDGLGNSLEIERIENDSIFGKFSVSFEMDKTRSKNVSGNPELVRFYNGEFRGIITE